MRAILVLLAIGILIIPGCLGSQAPVANSTNQSKAIMPRSITNVTNTTGVSNLTNASNVTANATNTTIQIPAGYEVKDYCVKDGDCVRQNQCCDCGPGEYVNRYNLDNPDCNGSACTCQPQASMGVCRQNKCMTVPLVANETTNQSEDEFYFRILGQPGCGNEIDPTKNITPYRTVMSGAISTPNPCYTANAVLGRNSTTYMVNITSAPLESSEACAQCTGAVYWLADINGSNDSVDVYYDGNLVYTDSNPFCGWSTGSCSTDSDCRTDGCNSEVCDSVQDQHMFTTCDWRSCYDPTPYKLTCGCVKRKCTWEPQGS
jgi:eight-cysteine-cluster-containing protein